MVNHPNRSVANRSGLTKKREGDHWRIYFDGKPTHLTIGKGESPRYRERQMYWVEQDVPGDQSPHSLFEREGVSFCMGVIESILKIANPSA